MAKVEDVIQHLPSAILTFHSHRVHGVHSIKTTYFHDLNSLNIYHLICRSDRVNQIQKKIEQR